MNLVWWDYIALTAKDIGDISSMYAFIFSTEEYFRGTNPAGATFVTNQFWCSLMFSPNVVGTANATAAGWGNLGGGVTQMFMISALFNPNVSSGMPANTAWRIAMIVPAVLFLICAATMKLLCWDTPAAKRSAPAAKRSDVSVTG